MFGYNIRKETITKKELEATLNQSQELLADIIDLFSGLDGMENIEITITKEPKNRMHNNTITVYTCIMIVHMKRLYMPGIITIAYNGKTKMASILTSNVTTIMPEAKIPVFEYNNIDEFRNALRIGVNGVLETAVTNIVLTDKFKNPGNHTKSIKLKIDHNKPFKDVLKDLSN